MIGERLAEIRKDHGDNQDDLARKLNVSVFAIRSWEDVGARLPTLSGLIRLPLGPVQHRPGLRTAAQTGAIFP